MKGVASTVRVAGECSRKERGVSDYLARPAIYRAKVRWVLLLLRLPSANGIETVAPVRLLFTFYIVVTVSLEK
jgi:hypothetical protein